MRYAWWRRTSTPTRARASAACAPGSSISRRPSTRALGRDADRPVEPRAQLDLARQRGRAALVTERVHRDLPAVAELAEQVGPRHDDVVEEQLAELGVAGDLRHRPQLHAGRSHVDDQHRDPAVLRPGVVRAGQHAAPARELPPGDPGLLPAEHEVVAAVLSAGSQRREVGAGVGLGEALAPDLVGGQDRRDVPAPLLVAAEAQQRRPEHVEADDVRELRRAGGRELLVDDDLLGGRPAAAAELERPGAADVAGRVAAGLPGAERLHPVLERARETGGVRALGGEEAADLLLEPALGLCRGELHELRSYQLSAGAVRRAFDGALHI